MIETDKENSEKYFYTILENIEEMHNRIKKIDKRLYETYYEEYSKTMAMIDSTEIGIRPYVEILGEKV